MLLLLIICLALNLGCSLDKLLKTLLHDGTSLERVPYLMRRLVDDIPADEVVRKSSQILLLSLPLAVPPDFDATGNDDKRGVGGLNVPSRRNLVLGEAVSNEVLLKLRLDIFARLVCIATVDTVFTGAALEECACKTDGTER